MKNNQRGVAEVAVLIYVVVGLLAVFVPNPVSSALGIGVRPNKTVQSSSRVEKVDFLKKDLLGKPVAEDDGSYLTKTTISAASSDVEKQQRVGILEQIRSLPFLLLLLVGLGVAFPPFGAILWALWARAKKAMRNVAGEKEALLTDTKKIVAGLEKAFDTVPVTLASAKLPGEVDIIKLSEQIVDEMKWTLGDYYNDSTKELVKKIRGK